MTGLFPYLLLMGTIAYALSFVPDDKWVLLLMVAVLAIMLLRDAEYNDGYLDGFKDSTCEFAEGFEASGRLDPEDIPEFCS